MIASLIAAPLALLLLQAAAAPAPGGVKTVVDALAALEAQSKPKLLNSGEVVRAEDYPHEAIQAEEQGLVRMRLTVNGQGRVTDCTIVQSSGSATLDRHSCSLYATRARFQVTRNKAGKPMPTSFEQNVTWALHGESGSPRKAWINRFSIVLSANGTVRSCQASVQGMPPSTCTVPSAFPAESAAQIAELAQSDPAQLVTETAFAPIKSAPVPEIPAGMGLMSRRIVTVEIAGDGTIARCEPQAPGLDKPGEMSACDQARQVRFASVKEGETGPANSVGTISLSTYAGPVTTPAAK